jgi:hypothetical protein
MDFRMLQSGRSSRRSATGTPNALNRMITLSTGFRHLTISSHPESVMALATFALEIPNPSLRASAQKIVIIRTKK